MSGPAYEVSPQDELAAARSEIGSLRAALGCVRPNATFALALLKVPSMDGGNLEKARGHLDDIRADVVAELARGGR